MFKKWLLRWKMRKLSADVSDRLNAIDHKLQLADRAHASLRESLSANETELTYIRERLNQSQDRVKAYETEIEALRNKLNVYENSTIPTLVASNELALKRIAADIAVQSKREVSGQ